MAAVFQLVVVALLPVVQGMKVATSVDPTKRILPRNRGMSGSKRRQHDREGRSVLLTSAFTI